MWGGVTEIVWTIIVSCEVGGARERPEDPRDKQSFAAAFISCGKREYTCFISCIYASDQERGWAYPIFFLSLRCLFVTPKHKQAR